jgi:hypothetical protein
MAAKHVTPPAFVPIGEWSPARQELEHVKAKLIDTETRLFRLRLLLAQTRRENKKLRNMVNTIKRLVGSFF